MKTYDMKSMFDKVDSWKEFQYDEKTKYNKLKKIIEFINEKFENEKDHFKKEKMNLGIEELKNKFNGYEFNTVTYIFLICLCETENLNFFKKLTKGKYTNEKESEEWLSTIDLILGKYKFFYEEETGKDNWDVIYINILSIYHELAKIQRNSIEIDDINKEITDIYTRIMLLPNDRKKELYEKGAKRRFNYIYKQLKEIVEKMEYPEKDMYELDLDLYKDSLK